MKSKINLAFQEYLKDNYIVSDEQAATIANGMEYYLQEALMPTIVHDNDLEERE